MATTNRQTRAARAALEAAELVSQLLALSKLDKWHGVRLEELATVVENLSKQIRGLLELPADVEPTLVLPPVAKAKSKTVFVPVDTTTGNSKAGGTWCNITGFIGGQQDNGVMRPHGKRHFPKVAITVPFNVSAKLVGVDRSWLMQYTNADVLIHVKKFPQIVTGL